MAGEEAGNMLFKEAYSVSLEMFFGYQVSFVFFLCFFSVRLLSVSLIGYGSAYNNYVHTCLKRTYKQNNCGLRPDIRVAIM